MIYSATMFFNELDLLDLKIKEELPYVDKMFVVEAAVTFTGNPKPLLFPRDKYNGKVEYISLEENDFKLCKTAWERERLQRNIVQKLVHSNDGDVWIVTDIDEIVCGDKIPEIVDETRNNDYILLGMDICYYCINVRYPLRWNYPFAVSGKIAMLEGFHELRKRTTMYPKKEIPKCGKHFSYLGGPEEVSLKMKSFSHTEYGGLDYTDIKTISKRIANLEDVCGRDKKMQVVPIDSSYPKTILENLPEWEKHIYREVEKCQT